MNLENVEKIRTLANSIETIIDTPANCLKYRKVRELHFVKHMNDHADNFELAFAYYYVGDKCHNALFFASTIPEKEISKYEKLIRKAISVKYADSKICDKCFNELSERFGEAGKTTWFDAFKFTHR